MGIENDFCLLFLNVDYIYQVSKCKQIFRFVFGVVSFSYPFVI